MVYLEVTMSHAILLVLLVIGSSLFVSYQAGNLMLDVMFHSTNQNKKNLRMVISTSGITMNVSIISCIFFLICNGAQYNQSVLEYVDNLLDIFLFMAFVTNSYLFYFLLMIKRDLKKNVSSTKEIYINDLSRCETTFFKDLNIFNPVNHNTEVVCFFCTFIRFALSSSLMIGVFTSNTVVMIAYNKCVKSIKINFDESFEKQPSIMANMVI